MAKTTGANDGLLGGLGALLYQSSLSSMKYLEPLSAFYLRLKLVRAQNLKRAYPDLNLILPGSADSELPSSKLYGLSGPAWATGLW